MGPFATHILADLGADVIKIEAPEGDILRAYEPQRSEGMAGIFLHLNRNKRSVVLDLKSTEARSALDRLIATSDVFLHALRPKAISRLGYDYDHVRTLRDDIIYCGAYGFGKAGCYADKAAYDDLIQAGSGLASLQGILHGKVGYVPTVICDKAAGQAIANAILAALYHRAVRGQGQSLEVPMYETMVEFNMIEHMGGLSFEPPEGRAGFSRVLNPSRRPFKTKDGYACILPYTDRNWRDFFLLIERPDLAADASVATIVSRTKIIGELYEEVAKAALLRPTSEWVEACDRLSIPCMPLLSLDELVMDPHLQQVGFFQIEEHPTEGTYRSMRSPTNFSKTPYKLRRHAPKLGENTAELLKEVGCSAPEATALAGKPTGKSSNREAV